MFRSLIRISTTLAIFMLTRAMLVEAFKIPSGSMEHTLRPGDFLLVNKFVYGAHVPFTRYRLPALRHPDRGDVVVFQWPEDPTKDFVKRVAGVPGDTLLMRDGALIRNGKRQREGYVIRVSPGTDPSGDDFTWQRGYLISSLHASTGYRPSRNNWGPLIVPRESYFVLGDNRDNSLDSRYWGFVPDSLVRGRPLVVYYSYEPDSASRADWLTGVRWARLGAIVR